MLTVVVIEMINTKIVMITAWLIGSFSFNRLFFSFFSCYRNQKSRFEKFEKRKANGRTHAIRMHPRGGDLMEENVYITQPKEEQLGNGLFDLVEIDLEVSNQEYCHHTEF